MPRSPLPLPALDFSEFDDDFAKARERAASVTQAAEASSQRAINRGGDYQGPDLETAYAEALKQSTRPKGPKTREEYEAERDAAFDRRFGDRSTRAAQSAQQFADNQAVREARRRSIVAEGNAAKAASAPPAYAGPGPGMIDRTGNDGTRVRQMAIPEKYGGGTGQGVVAGTNFRSPQPALINGRPAEKSIKMSAMGQDTRPDEMIAGKKPRRRKPTG